MGFSTTGDTHWVCAEGLHACLRLGTLLLKRLTEILWR